MVNSGFVSWLCSFRFKLSGTAVPVLLDDVVGYGGDPAGRRRMADANVRASKMQALQILPFQRRVVREHEEGMPAPVVRQAKSVFLHQGNDALSCLHRIGQV
ncbi:MAG: hypothetical protein ACJ8G3_12865 [Burkholderiaceae bacterium]